MTKRSTLRRLGTLLAALAIALFATGSAVLGDDEAGANRPLDNIHNTQGTSTPTSNAVYGTDNSRKNGQVICSTTTSNAANVNTDCPDNSDGVGIHNETSIAVNPTDAMNMIGGANDYQLALNPGGQVSETVFSRAHVTMDGGKTWTLYPINFDSHYSGTGDPSIAFDNSGHAYYATLAFRFAGPYTGTNPDIVVANSGDGGVHWSSVRVAKGTGSFGSAGNSLDKEYITAWGDGNALVVWGNFIQGAAGSYLSARIFSSVTHDAGAHWTVPQIISGDTLIDAFAGVPAVSDTTSNNPDAVYVAFMNTDDYRSTGCASNGDCRDNYYVQKLDPATGAPDGSAAQVGLVYDGVGDYPVFAGRTTYANSGFRTWAAGNVAVDPTDPSHLAVVWTDMRNSPFPADPDPFSGSAVTNSDVVISESTDGGDTWSAPAAIEIANDQFMPWAAYDGTGTLRVGYFDRSGNAANTTYDYAVGTWTSGSSFDSSTTVSTVSSDPTSGTRWFSSSFKDEGYPTTFLGDYSNIAWVPGTDADVVAYWTDLRNSVDFAGRTGTTQDAYFAAFAAP
jgi:hypothetical protein